MAISVFPDNTVLCNFAAVGRVDLLEGVLRGRGRWTESVAAEARKSAGYLPDLNRLIANGWMGDEIEVTDEGEINLIERIRRSAFGGTSDRPLQHLGEAQTVFLIRNRAELSGAWWVTDDRAALQYARGQQVITRESMSLMAEAVANGDVTAEQGFELLHGMADQHRHLSLPQKPSDLLA